MTKLEAFKEQYGNKLVLGVKLGAMSAVMALVPVASAQTATPDGSTVVQGLNLTKMIETVGAGIRQVIVDNGGALVLAILPLLAFYFIWNKVRGLF